MPAIRSLERLTYDRTAKAVTYRSDKAEGPTAGTETADPLEFLARVVHIPDKGHVTTRYYGWYANRPRGAREVEMLVGMFDGMRPMRSAWMADEINSEMKLLAKDSKHSGVVPRMLSHAPGCARMGVEGAVNARHVAATSGRAAWRTEYSR